MRMDVGGLSLRILLRFSCRIYLLLHFVGHSQFTTATLSELSFRRNSFAKSWMCAETSEKINTGEISQTGNRQFILRESITSIRRWIKFANAKLFNYRRQRNSTNTFGFSLMCSSKLQTITKYCPVNLCIQSNKYNWHCWVKDEERHWTKRVEMKRASEPKKIRNQIWEGAKFRSAAIRSTRNYYLLMWKQ